MATCFYYSVVGGFILLVLYIVYRWVMASENQHGFNRAVIMGIYIVSFVIFPLLSLFQSRAVGGMELATIKVVGVSTIIKEDNITLVLRLLLWIYLVGCVIMLLMTLDSYRRLVCHIRKGKIIRCDGYIIVVTDGDSVAPFSWMRYIVLSQKDFKDRGDLIVCHERQHLRLGHWMDLLVAQVVLIFNWFNPAAWLMREELKTVHEYQADMGVLASGVDMKSYHLLLISKAVGKKFPGLVNSLNHSKLKKRINMMLSPRKSTILIKMRSICLLPALVLACVVVSWPVVGRSLSSLRYASFVKKELPEVVNISGKNDDNGLENVVIFLNGKEIEKSEMNEIDPSVISDITVRKDKGAIYIQTK